MGNFTLQKGPCSFLKLRISPWEIPSILLLSSSLSWCLLSFSFPTGGSSIKIPLFLPLSLYFPSSAGITRGSSAWALHPRASDGSGARERAARPDPGARARRPRTERLGRGGRRWQAVCGARGQQAGAAQSGCARALCQAAAWEACAGAMLERRLSGR
jgi:hypothetical protein